MTSTYPGVIRPFTVKQNIVQDVDASHVNDLQDEVVALETTIGVNPHYDTGLFTAGVVQNRTTLGNRVGIAEAGTEHPFGQWQYINSNWGTSEQTIIWNSELQDTHNMWSGGQDHITIARNGYWQFNANAILAAPGSNPGASSVWLLRIFTLQGSTTSEIAGIEITYPANTNPDVRLSCSACVPLNKGDQVSVSMLGSLNRNVTKATFQAAFLRGL